MSGTCMAEVNENISSEQLKLVLDVSRTLAVTTDLDLLLKYLAESGQNLLDCARTSIFLHDRKTGELWTKVALGTKEIRVPAGAGIVGHVFTANQMLHVPKPYEDARFNQDVDKKTGFVTRNLLTAPMVGIDGQPVGVIQAVNKCTEAFTETDFAILQLLADHAGVAIQRFNLMQEAIERVELKREMDLAQRVQQALIPKDPPTIPGVEVVGWTRAASITGGDCYDLWTLPDGRLAIFLADASGHGIAPALVVSQVRTLIRALVNFEPNPSRLLACVNERMYEDLQDGQFITVFLGYLSSDGSLEWTSAGQGPILAKTSPNGPVTILDTPGYPIGFTPAWPDSPGQPLKLEPGGVLFAASDGIFEAMDPDGKLFGHESVVERLEKGVGETPGKAVETIREAVNVWQTKEEPNDDQTIVVVHRFK